MRARLGKTVACQVRQDEVAKLEAKQAQATNKVCHAWRLRRSRCQSAQSPAEVGDSGDRDVLGEGGELNDDVGAA
jgi:hypothetical protein